jgi:hypothetical protein
MDNKLSELKATIPADKKTREAVAAGFVTDNNTGGYFVIECQECGAVYPSQQADGGGQIADTGDYDDAICPHCGEEGPEECVNVGLAWNVQQAKIVALLAELEAKDQALNNITELWKDANATAFERIRELKEELEAKDKRIADLERILTDTERERDDWVDHSRKMEQRAIEAEKRLATPVQLQNCDFESVAIMAHWCSDEQLEAWVKGVEHAKEQIRAAGFKVEGDE